MRLIMEGAEFIATNTDGSFPTLEGINPGTDNHAKNQEPTIIGKPQKALFETAMERFNAVPQNTLMVGDRLETDILGASLLGITTVAVLTGVTSQDELTRSDIKPDHIFESISDFHQDLQLAYS